MGITVDGPSSLVSWLRDKAEATSEDLHIVAVHDDEVIGFVNLANDFSLSFEHFIQTIKIQCECDELGFVIVSGTDSYVDLPDSNKIHDIANDYDTDILDVIVADYDKGTQYSPLCDGGCCGPDNQVSFGEPRELTDDQTGDMLAQISKLFASLSAE